MQVTGDNPLLQRYRTYLPSSLLLNAHAPHPHSSGLISLELKTPPSARVRLSVSPNAHAYKKTVHRPVTNMKRSSVLWLLPMIFIPTPICHNLEFHIFR